VKDKCVKCHGEGKVSPLAYLHVPFGMFVPDAETCRDCNGSGSEIIRQNLIMFDQVIAPSLLYV
jgi:DnaJ-class molecular chaperone